MNEPLCPRRARRARALVARITFAAAIAALLVAPPAFAQDAAPEPMPAPANAPPAEAPAAPLPTTAQDASARAATATATAPAPTPTPLKLLPPLSFVPEPPRAPALPFPVVPAVAARTFVLPLGILSPSMTLLADRPGARVAQSANLGFGLAVGAGRNTEVAASITAPIEGITHLRAGLTLQLRNGAHFQLALRPEVGTTHIHESEGPREVIMRPGLSLPMAFLFGRFVRLDTALSANAFLSTRREYGFAVTNRTVDPSIERPGIPVELTLQLERSFFFGAESGAGLLPKPALIDQSDIEGGIFVPVGLFVGGTISAANRPLVDFIGSLRAPYLYLVERDGLRIDPWQASVTMRGFIEL